MTLLAVLAVVGMASAAVAPGGARGMLILDGHRFELGYAYAQPHNDARWPIEVAITDRPLRVDLLDGEKPLETVARESDANGIGFFMQGGRPTILHVSTSPWGGFGCGTACDELLDFQPSASDATHVAGHLASRRTIVFGDQKLTLQVDFAAEVRSAAPAPKGNAGQEQARRLLLEKGFPFTKGNFFKAAFSWNAEAVTLFLRAGMHADTASPKTDYSLLMSLLGSQNGCQDREEAALITILLRGGADPNQLQPGGLPRTSTPLGRAYPCPNRMQMLINAGARLDAPARDPSLGRLTVGRLLMEEAIDDEEAVVVAVLIKNGYDVKSEGADLLGLAEGQPQIEQLLMAAGATRPPPNKRRRSPSGTP